MEASFLLNLPMRSLFFSLTALHHVAALRMTGGGKKEAGLKRLQDGLVAAEAGTRSMVVSIALAMASPDFSEISLDSKQCPVNSGFWACAGEKAACIF